MQVADVSMILPQLPESQGPAVQGTSEISDVASLLNGLLQNGKSGGEASGEFGDLLGSLLKSGDLDLKTDGKLKKFASPEEAWQFLWESLFAGQSQAGLEKLQSWLALPDAQSLASAIQEFATKSEGALDTPTASSDISDILQNTDGIDEQLFAGLKSFYQKQQASLDALADAALASATTENNIDTSLISEDKSEHLSEKTTTEALLLGQGKLGDESIQRHPLLNAHHNDDTKHANDESKDEKDSSKIHARDKHEASALNEISSSIIGNEKANSIAPVNGLNSVLDEAGQAIAKIAGGSGSENASGNASSDGNFNGMHGSHETNSDASVLRYSDRIMPQVVRGFLTSFRDGGKSIHMQLSPEHLGKVKLSIEMQGNLLTGRMLVENDGVRSLLENQLNGLRQSLEEHGVKIEALEVAVEDKKENATFAQWQNEHSGRNSSSTHFSGNFMEDVDVSEGLDGQSYFGWNTRQWIA